MACENSRLTSLPIRVRKFHTDDVRVNFVILHKLSVVVFVNRTRHFSILHYTPRKVCAKPSYILTYLRVALATSDAQSTLEIPATDEIHTEDRNQTCVSTATFESCGTRAIDGRINLYTKLGKHKLDQIAERNIRISLDKVIAFSK